jgi:outer membrane protein
MKFNRFFLLLTFIAICAAVPALGQTRPAATRPAATQPKPAATQPAPSQPVNSNAPVPDAKIAMIYSAAFMDTKGGIARFVSLVNTLNREFQQRDAELQQIQTKMNQLQDELTKAQAASSVVSVDTIRAKADQLDQLKRDFQRKGEDAQAAFDKRKAEIFRPLQDEIGKALEAYAKAHNITVILDGSQVPVVYAADATDITAAFITDFNTKNPATAAVTTPR